MEYKRLARKNQFEAEIDTVVKEDDCASDDSEFSDDELTLTKYSDKSFVVRGCTSKHEKSLDVLGGSYNLGLRGGKGWIFPNFRRDAVEEYMSTGKINFKGKKQNNPPTSTVTPPGNDDRLRQLFKDLKIAFEEEGSYDHESIMDVFNQLEKRYL